MVAFRVGPFGTWVRLLLETWKFTVQTEEPIVSAGGPGEILGRGSVCGFLMEVLFLIITLSLFMLSDHSLGSSGLFFF